MKYNLIEYFSETVSQNRDKIAVIEGEQHISFGDLDRKAKALATYLIQQADVCNTPIGVFLPKTIDSVISNIAITYSGNMYMNLDIKVPLQRLNNIADLICPKIIITNTKLLPALNLDNKDVIIVNIDTVDLEQASSIDFTARLSRLIDTDPLCIINTSGSTGTPKGVVLNHKSFIDFIHWTLQTFSYGADEVIGSLSPLVFDIYSFELCMLMSRGSTLVIIPDTLAAFPVKILELLQRHRVSFIFWVPTIMVNIANMKLLEAVALPDLKIVWFAGEVFPTIPFNYWRKQLPQVQFTNLYGPIEITLDCTYFIVDRDIPDHEPLPIGIPCRNTDILILNDQEELVKDGEEGELCVRGTSLAMGYYNNKEKTDAAFVQNPLNKAYPELIYRTGDIACYNDRGEIVFRGRKDSLIKHLGYRIELGEIEHVIVNTLKLVKNGCVVYQRAQKEITLIYESESDISPATFRKSIGEALPKYMVPTAYIRKEEMPRNTNGKIDRLSLNVEVNG